MKFYYSMFAITFVVEKYDSFQHQNYNNFTEISVFVVPRFEVQRNNSKYKIACWGLGNLKFSKNQDQKVLV